MFETHPSTPISFIGSHGDFIKFWVEQGKNSMPDHLPPVKISDELTDPQTIKHITEYCSYTQHNTDSYLHALYLKTTQEDNIPRKKITATQERDRKFIALQGLAPQLANSNWHAYQITMNSQKIFAISNSLAPWPLDFFQKNDFIFCVDINPTISFVNFLRFIELTHQVFFHCDDIVSALSYAKAFDPKWGELTLLGENNFYSSTLLFESTPYEYLAIENAHHPINFSNLENLKTCHQMRFLYLGTIKQMGEVHFFHECWEYISVKQTTSLFHVPVDVFIFSQLHWAHSQKKDLSLFYHILQMGLLQCQFETSKQLLREVFAFHRLKYHQDERDLKFLLIELEQWKQLQLVRPPNYQILYSHMQVILKSYQRKLRFFNSLQKELQNHLDSMYYDPELNEIHTTK